MNHQTTLDLIVAIFAILSTVCSACFWMASVNIKKDISHEIEKVDNELNGKLEVDLMRIKHKLEHYKACVKAKFVVFESRIHRFEAKLDRNSSNKLFKFEADDEDEDEET